MGEQHQKPVRKVSLRHLIYSQFRRSALIPILMIDLVLLLMYFGINSYISSRNIAILEQLAHQDLAHINRGEVANIDQRLHEVSGLARVLQSEHQAFFARLANGPALRDEYLPNGAPRFERHANGALYKLEDNGGGSLYYSGATEMTPQRMRLARESELMDPLLQSVVESNEIVTQAYINTPDDLNRIYPFIPESAAVFGPAMNMEEFNFFFEADELRNPERVPVWTDSYLDPAGQGWMVSCVVPIWQGGELRGVTGLDVTMQTFADKILNLQLPWSGGAFLIDKNATILAMPADIEKVLGLKELKDHVYDEVVGEQVLRPEEYNLRKHPDLDLRRQFMALLVSDQKLGRLNHAGRTFLVNIDEVPTTGWQVVFLVDQQELLEPVQELHRFYKQIGYFAAAAMLVFYLLFFAWLNVGAGRLSSRITRPLDELGEATRDIARPDTQVPIEGVGIVELDALARNFNSMQEELSDRTDKLVESRIKARLNNERVRLYRDASLTDKLTGLANRERLNARIQDEIERQRRDQTPWSLIMLDVDHFKQVNDTHGHLAGDAVLKALAKTVGAEIRGSDLLGRWGGEEFMVVLSATSAEQATEVAEKIRSAVAASAMGTVEDVTLSCGVAQYQAEETVDQLIARVDQALYEAKEQGRNRVCPAE